MSDSKSTVTADGFNALLKFLQSEPEAKTSTITHKESESESIIAFRGEGTVTNWRQGRDTILFSPDVEKFMTVAIATKERGLLFPMALISQDQIDQGLDCFRSWWSENKNNFNKARLYVTMPDWSFFPDAYAKSHALVPKVEKLTDLKANVKSWHGLPDGKAAFVWLVADGTGRRPKMWYSNKPIDPAVPPSDDDSRIDQQLWDEFESSG